jgi:hypothetical protein
MKQQSIMKLLVFEFKQKKTHKLEKSKSFIINVSMFDEINQFIEPI